MLYEVTPIKSHTLNFVSSEVLERSTGFRSICAYDAAGVARAKKAGSITALRDEPHLCETMFLDFDNNEVAGMAAAQWCEDQGLAFQCFTSGGRSIHVEVLLSPLYHKNAAYSVRKFSERFTGVDTSYQHYAGLFRLPGTVHEKTGNPKQLIKEACGKQLTIPLVDRPVTGLQLKAKGLEGDLLSPYIGYYQTLVGACPTEGNRHKALLTQAFNFRELGFSLDTTEELLAALNSTWQNPKTPLEIRKICNDAYGSRR